MTLQERRKNDLSKTSPLPIDYLKMVTQVFMKNFDTTLKEIKKIKGKSAFFDAHGNVYATELLVSVSLVIQDQLTATTIYASCDYDPKASSPKVDELLGNCVDAIGGVFFSLLDKKTGVNLDPLLDGTLNDLEDIPFEWTEMEIDKRRVFVKIDKANPALDKMADDWLAKNDPQQISKDNCEQHETAKLFIAGPNNLQKNSRKKH